MEPIPSVWSAKVCAIDAIHFAPAFLRAQGIERIQRTVINEPLQHLETPHTPKNDGLSGSRGGATNASCRSSNVSARSCESVHEYEATPVKLLLLQLFGLGPGESASALFRQKAA